MILKNTINSIIKLLNIQNNSNIYKDYSTIEYLEPIHYNLITSFHKKNNNYKINKSSFNSDVWSFMDRVWVYSQLKIFNITNPFIWNNKNLIEVTNIKNWYDVDIVSNKFINNLSKNFCNDSKKHIDETEIIDNIRYTLQELFNNILNHSTDINCNFSSGHYNKNNKTIQFAIVDSWIWIKKDIEKTNKNITSDKQAIITALQMWKSWKLIDWKSINTNPYNTNENAWYWLTVVSKIIKDNDWDIVIWTGNYIYVYDSFSKNEYYTKIPEWKWTFVFFNMYTNKMNIFDYWTILCNLKNKDNSELIEEINFNN